MDKIFYLRKFQYPGRPSTTLYRETLVTTLQNAIIGEHVEGSGIAHQYRLVILCAPAGYGKTTLLSDFADHSQFPCCWYFLDRMDVDRLIFLEMLLTSIRQRFPAFGKALDVLLRNVRDMALTNGYYIDTHHYEAILDTLVEAISNEISERFAIMLCNYHHINASKEMNALINRFVQHLPAHCVVVIESRAVPGLNFAHFLGQQEVFGLGSNGLRFTASEIKELARIQGREPLCDEEAEQLIESFDGWIAGILLGTRLGNLQFLCSDEMAATRWGSPAVRMTRQNLFAYVVNEVFKHEQAMSAFLSEVVVLRQMTSDLCIALLDMPDAGVHLAYLDQQGLFVTHVEVDSQVMYICHPVLRELLYDDLRSQSLERFVFLHRRAMQLFLDSGDHEQAIYHALEAMEYDLAAQLILEISKHILAKGHITLLVDWIDSLPIEIVDRYPYLLVVHAHIHLLLGQHDQAQSLLEKALASINQPAMMENDEIQSLQVDINVIRSSVLFQIGDYSQAQELCEQSLDLLAFDQVSLRAQIHLRLGLCANMTGRWSIGVTELQRALRLIGNAPIDRQIAQLHNTLANTYGILGKHVLAEHHRSYAFRCWDELKDEWGKADSLVSLGVTRHRQGSFTEAETALKQALITACGSIHYLRGQAYARVSLGDLYLDQEDYERSLTMTQEGLALARQLKDQYLESCAQAILASIYLFMEDFQTAWLLISNVKQEQADTFSYEHVMETLIKGTIRLYQKQYNDASIYLTTAEALLASAGMKREWLQAVIRLIACKISLGETAVAIQRMDDSLARATLDGYDLLAVLEIRRIPGFLESLQQLPIAAHVYDRIDTIMKANEDNSLRRSSLQQPIVRVPPQIRLKVFTLGESQVLIDEEPVVRWRVARAMELFFYLLDCGKPVRKDVIVEALWSEEEEQVDQALRSVVYYLRKALGESVLVFHAGMYTLDLTLLYGETIFYDVAYFLEQYTHAKQALKMHDKDLAELAFREMVQLYQGDYVPGIYSNWCIPHRDQLRHAYIDARQYLASWTWEREQFEECISHWQQILVVDRCMEDAHYGLMRCYLHQGKRGFALRQYQRCTEDLHTELAVEPGLKIQKLYEHITTKSK